MSVAESPKVDQQNLNIFIFLYPSLSGLKQFEVFLVESRKSLASQEAKEEAEGGHIASGQP